MLLQELEPSIIASVAAMVRSVARSNKFYKPSEIIKSAWSLSVWEPLDEAVVVFWKPKSGGKYRPICKFGIRRKAQGFMVRDMLMIAGISAKNNFAMKGSGGEKALVRQVCEHIEDGKAWWWTPDIKSAFPSMLPGHFKWLGLDRRLLCNVIYLPKCAGIVIQMPKGIPAFKEFLFKEMNVCPDDNVSFLYIAKLMIRRGLPQGSVLSPLLAGALISKVWEGNKLQSVGVMLSWHDDLNIGSATKTQISGVREKLTSAMKSLSAGSIEFHDSKVLYASTGHVTILGFKVQPGRGHIRHSDGSRSIHVKPGPKRIAKYIVELKKRLEKATPEDDPIAIAKKYHNGWYGAQGSWTKVPGFSSELSRTILLTYVQDFKNGIEIGSGWVK